jgi:Tol biopolymer transport system component
MKRMLSLAAVCLLGGGLVTHTMAQVQTIPPDGVRGILRDTEHIAFMAPDPRGGGSGYYVLRQMNPDGAGTIDLWATRISIADLGYGSGYAFTPDGQTLIYSTNDGTYVQARGRARTKIMDTIIEGINVSPDGRKLVYTRKVVTSTDPGGVDIYVSNLDGTGERQLTNARGAEVWPAWSPDGRKILYGQGAGAGEIQRLMVMEADGSGQHAITRGSSMATGEIKFNMGKWSPDGTKIVAQGYTTIGTVGSRQIYTLNADGTSPRQLTTDALMHTTPSWSLDGRKILFSGPTSAASTAKWDIFVMDADGTHLTNLTNTPDISETSPKWQAPVPPLRVRL